MKKAIKLKWVIAISLLTLVGATIGGFTLLSGHYFILGMDSMVVGHIEKNVEGYHQYGKLDQYAEYVITDDWQSQPKLILNAFDTAPKEVGKLYKVEDFGKGRGTDSVFFSMKWVLEKKVYFVSHRMRMEVVSTMLHRSIKSSLDTLLITSGCILVLFCFILWFLMRRVSQPIVALNNWTRALNPGNLKNTIPDFTYRELNEQATLISQSLSTVQASLERESQFLRHTSHELRTPISVIRSNIDLMHKLVESGQSSNDTRQQQVIDRIDRASLTMKGLTETLLWLGREDSENLPKSTVQLDALIQQLAHELNYLLDAKAVEVDVQTEPFAIKLSTAATHIVLGNLIRNAFQHSSGGKVLIWQRGAEVTIVNELGDEGAADLGFGLGLQLIEQLTQRLHWDYKAEQVVNSNTVTINFEG